MDSHKTAGVARVYVPNEYTVYLSGQGPGSGSRGTSAGWSRSSRGTCSEHARRRSYDLLTRPTVAFETDERLRLGEFGIQTRLVKPAGTRGRGSPARARRVTRWSTRRCSDQPPRGWRPRPPRRGRDPRGRHRTVIAATCWRGPRATIGRSKDADCVLRDPNVSRHHAELRRAPTGEWTIADLGSTNGIKVNGRRVGSTRLKSGDRVTVGTTTFLIRRRAVRRGPSLGCWRGL